MSVRKKFTTKAPRHQDTKKDVFTRESARSSSWCLGALVVKSLFDDQSLDARVSDLSAVIDHLGAAKVDVFATLTGGAVTIAFAVAIPKSSGGLSSRTRSCASAMRSARPGSALYGP